MDIRKALNSLFSGISADLPIRYSEAILADAPNLVTQPCGLLEFQVAGVFQHLFFELGGAFEQLLGRHRRI
jgi:hypothetical protein